MRLKTAPAHKHLFLFATKLLSDNYALKYATICEFLLHPILYVHIEEDLDFKIIDLLLIRNFDRKMKVLYNLLSDGSCSKCNNFSDVLFDLS